MQKKDLQKTAEHSPTTSIGAPREYRDQFLKLPAFEGVNNNNVYIFGNFSFSRVDRCMQTSENLIYVLIVNVNDFVQLSKQNITYNAGLSVQPKPALVRLSCFAHMR